MSPMTTITFPARIDSLPRGLALVVECATAAGFPPQRVIEIELAVEEDLALGDEIGEHRLRRAELCDDVLDVGADGVVDLVPGLVLRALRRGADRGDEVGQVSVQLAKMNVIARTLPRSSLRARRLPSC